MTHVSIHGHLSIYPWRRCKHNWKRRRRNMKARSWAWKKISRARSSKPRKSRPHAPSMMPNGSNVSERSLSLHPSPSFSCLLPPSPSPSFSCLLPPSPSLSLSFLLPPSLSLRPSLSANVPFPCPRAVPGHFLEVQRSAPVPASPVPARLFFAARARDTCSCRRW